MKKFSVRMLTWLLALVMAFSGVAMAETATPAEATAIEAVGTQSTVETITVAAEYLGSMLNASVVLGTDEDGCQQMTVTAPYLEDTLFVQFGEKVIVVRYGENAVELSTDVVGEALGMLTYMSYGMDMATAKALYAYASSSDAQMDEALLSSILNTEMTRLLNLVMERGLLQMTENGGFEVNATVEDMVSLLAEYLTRASADANLMASLSQLRVWSYFGIDPQTLPAQMAAMAEAMKAEPLTGISGSLRIAILAQDQMSLTFDLKVDACNAEIHAAAEFNGEQLVADLHMSANDNALNVQLTIGGGYNPTMLLNVACEVGGKSFALNCTANEDGVNAEFNLTEANAASEATASEIATSRVLFNGTLTAGEKGLALSVSAMNGGYLTFRMTEESYDEYRTSLAFNLGGVVLDADIHTDYDLFEMKANLKVADTSVRLTLNVNDDDVDGRLDMVADTDAITITLHGRDDVFTINGFGRADDVALSMNMMIIETYRGYEGTFTIDMTDDEVLTSVDGSLTFDDERYAYEYTILQNGQEITRCTYELTAEGIKSEMITAGTIQRTETTFERTATGMNLNGTVKSYVVDESGAETEANCVYTNVVIDGVNFTCDMSVKVGELANAVPIMSYSGTAITEENRLAYRIDMNLYGQTLYLEAGLIREEPEMKDEIRGRLYLTVGMGDQGESRIDLPFSVVLTETLTDIKLALEATQNGVTESVGSLSVKLETVTLEAAPAHVTGTPITAEQLLQLLAQ